MNGRVASVAFSPDSKTLYSFGSSCWRRAVRALIGAGQGKVCVWDVAARDCVHVFDDEGTLHGTTMALSADGQFIACGSDSGVVNVYAVRSAMQSRAPKPLKTFLNLTTAITGIAFNHDAYAARPPTA